MATRINIFGAALLTVVALAAGCSESNTTAVPVDTVPPAIPNNVAGSVSQHGMVGLAWGANVSDPDLAAYVVYRSSDGENFSLIGEGNTNSWQDSDVQAGGRYHYRVSALDTSGNESGNSNAIQIVVPTSEMPRIFQED